MEDLKQAILASQVEDSALGTRYSRYYTAMRLTDGTIKALGEQDKSAGEAAIRLAHSTGYQTRGDFVEGIVYDTVLGLTVYHLHATQGIKAPQTFVGSERSTLINSIRRDWVELNEQMTLISEQSEPELLAYIAAMRKKLWFLSEMVRPTAATDRTPISMEVNEREVTVLMKDGRPIAVLDKDSFDRFPKPDRFVYMTEWQAVSDDSEVTKLYVAIPETPAPSSLTLTSYTVKRTDEPPFNPKVGMRLQVVKTVESLISQPFTSYGDAIRYAEALAAGEAEES